MLRRSGDVGYSELRVAILSPFVDRRHGTERCLAEQLERFAAQPGAEIHLYSQGVEDLRGVVRYPEGQSPGRIIWHRIPSIAGPHLIAYLWWLAANRIQRWWDSRVRGMKFEVVYSAGINSFDADVITVHVVFNEVFRRVRRELSFRATSSSIWPVLLHRRLYYGLICLLEKRIYARKNTRLIAVSQHCADCLRQFFGRESVQVIRHGVDAKLFNPAARAQHRNSARASFQLGQRDFCLLLIGNDLKNKGLDTLLKAMAECRDVPLVLLAVSSDARGDHMEAIRALRLEREVRFLNPSPNVLQFYAAADAYAGPSREDAYGLPILEAMACGLPVIASAHAGASEIIRDDENGLIQRNPEDADELAGLIRRIYSDRPFAARLAQAATRTAAEQSWDRNASETWGLLSAGAKQRGD